MNNIYTRICILTALPITITLFCCAEYDKNANISDYIDIKCKIDTIKPDISNYEIQQTCIDDNLDVIYIITVNNSYKQIRSASLIGEGANSFNNIPVVYKYPYCQREYNDNKQSCDEILLGSTFSHAIISQTGYNLSNKFDMQYYSVRLDSESIKSLSVPLELGLGMRFYNKYGTIIFYDCWYIDNSKDNKIKYSLYDTKTDNLLASFYTYSGYERNPSFVSGLIGSSKKHIIIAEQQLELPIQTTFHLISVEPDVCLITSTTVPTNGYVLDICEVNNKIAVLMTKYPFIVYFRSSELFIKAPIFLTEEQHNDIPIPKEISFDNASLFWPWVVWATNINNHCLLNYWNVDKGGCAQIDLSEYNNLSENKISDCNELRFLYVVDERGKVVLLQEGESQPIIVLTPEIQEIQRQTTH